jgi:hypothetical protein
MAHRTAIEVVVVVLASVVVEQDEALETRRRVWQAGPDWVGRIS